MTRWAFLALVLFALWPAGRTAAAASCSFSISTLDFGSVDTLSEATADGTATLSINCTNVVTGALRICPNIGSGSGGATGNLRHMRDASNRPLDYTLSVNLGGGTLWGTIENLLLGTPPTIDLTTTLFGSISTTRTIYGTLAPNQQSAAAGLYTSNFGAGDVKISYSELQLFNCLTLSSPVSASFQVRALVEPHCLISAQTVNFGPRGVLAANADAFGDLSVTCTPGATYSIALDNGLTGTGPTARRMTLGANAIAYGLYLDAARSQPWGSGGGQVYGGTGTGAAQAVRVYGRVPPQTTPLAGVYTDTVVATITY